jgi:hypothetical protein
MSVLALCAATAAVAQGGMAMHTGSNASVDTAQLARIRTALDQYKDPMAAVRDGYFSTVSCIDYPTAGGTGDMAYKAGAMGVHFLNAALIGPQLDTLHPQVLIYEPVSGDSLRLVAAEWFVPVQVSKTRPHLFGRDLDGPMEGHTPIMPAGLYHWDLHVWLWKSNPSGMFSPTNPTVHCPDGGYTMRAAPPHMMPQQ